MSRLAVACSSYKHIPDGLWVTSEIMEFELVSGRSQLDKQFLKHKRSSKPLLRHCILCEKVFSVLALDSSALVKTDSVELLELLSNSCFTKKTNNKAKLDQSADSLWHHKHALAISGALHISVAVDFLDRCFGLNCCKIWPVG